MSEVEYYVFMVIGALSLLPVWWLLSKTVAQRNSAAATEMHRGYCVFMLSAGALYVMRDNLGIGLVIPIAFAAIGGRIIFRAYRSWKYYDHDKTSDSA